MAKCFWGGPGGMHTDHTTHDTHSVTGKELPPELIVREQAVSEAWVADKLERKSGHAAIRTITAMLETVCGPNVLERSKLPSALAGIMRLPPGSRREMHDNRWCIESEGGDVTPIIPAGWQSSEVFIVGHGVDRCKVGGSGLAFAMVSQHLCWHPWWGRFHDSWNGINTSSKKTRGGVIWKVLLKFTDVANLPFGPYRSGALKSQLQQTLTTLTSTMSEDDPDFQRAAQRQQALERDRFVGPNAMRNWWLWFSRLPSCTVGGGPALMFSRWWSAIQCWRMLRKEWFLLEPVLRELGKDFSQAEAAADERTAQWDTTLTEHAKQRKGRLARAPGNITEEVATLMDVFELVTKGYAEQYQHQAAEVKSVKDHWANELKHIQGGWMNPVRTASRILSDINQIEFLFSVGGVPEDALCEILYDFHVANGGERVHLKRDPTRG